MTKRVVLAGFVLIWHSAEVGNRCLSHSLSSAGIGALEGKNQEHLVLPSHPPDRSDHRCSPFRFKIICMSGDALLQTPTGSILFSSKLRMFWDERWPGSQRGMQVEMHGAFAPAKCLLGLGHQAPKLEARKHCVETSTVKIGPGPEPEQWGFDRGFFGTAQHESQFWPDATSTFYIESFWPFPSGQIKLAFFAPASATPALLRSRRPW